MPDKLSVIALREVGNDTRAADKTIEQILDKYAPSIAKEAARRAKASVLSEVGAKSVEEFAQVPILRAERDARPTPAEMIHAKKAARNFGALLGACAGAALAVIIGSTLLLAGSRATVEGAAWGSMLGRQSSNVDRLERIDGTQQEPESGFTEHPRDGN